MSFLDDYSTAKPATDRQINLLVRLVTERRADPDAPSAARVWAERQNTKTVSQQIERMLAEPKLTDRQAPAAAPVVNEPAVNETTPLNHELAPGMYRRADRLYRVYPARNGGHLLAKQLVSNGPDGGWSFEYAGSAPRFVSPVDRMTLEEAKAWGAQYGSCCVCGALLTDPESVARGIGPICGGRV